ncbi:MAG: PAS domain-containing protein, partial [Bacteroidales bacterium]
MNIRVFVFQLLGRLFLILITVLTGIYFYINVDKLFSVTGVLLLIFLQIILLIRYCKRIDNELSGYFESLSCDDFQSVNPTSPLIERHSNLGHTLDEFKKHVEAVRKESQVREVLMKRFLENVDTGIILFDDREHILWLNSTALRILGINRFSSIRDLWKTYPELSEVFGKIKTGERRIHRLNTGNDLRTLTLKKSEFNTEDKKLTLFAFDHISNEYSDIEQESWEKLIRVITHEIMNTLTPITALTQSIKKELRGDAARRKRFLEATDKSLDLIEERSKGLLEFVRKYRQVTLTPQLNRVGVNVAELLYNIRLLFEENKAIEIKIDIKPIDLEIFADKELFSQVIINVIKNSAEAMTDRSNGEVRINALKDENNKTLIRIRDNGPGIDEAMLGKIFIPFFTTKKTGTGIGLGYSRKIVRL